MKTKQKNKNEKKVIKKKVLTSLKKHIPPEFGADINVYAIRQAPDGWWHVSVYPSRSDIKNYHYYHILADVEGDLQDEQQLNLVLVPVRPKG